MNTQRYVSHVVGALWRMADCVRWWLKSPSGWSSVLCAARMNTTSLVTEFPPEAENRKPSYYRKPGKCAKGKRKPSLHPEAGVSALRPFRLVGFLPTCLRICLCLYVCINLTVTMKRRDDGKHAKLVYQVFAAPPLGVSPAPGWGPRVGVSHGR